MKLNITLFRLTDLNSLEYDGGILEGAFLNEGFHLFAQFKRNGVLAENGQSLKHTLDCTETEVNS